jgi:hypothetical protein
MLVTAVAFSDLVLGLHIAAALVGFGAVFVYPLLFSFAGRRDPHVMPFLLRSRQQVGRYLVNPGLLLVVLGGIYLATDEHQWSHFYVGWGIIAALVIGAIEGAVVIPRSNRLAAVAERDLSSTAVAAGGQRVSAQWSVEYTRGWRVLWLSGVLVELIVVITVFLMATHAG